MVKAIIFDCFGVLIGKGFEHTYRLAGGNPEQDEEFIELKLYEANFGAISDADFHQAMADKIGIGIDRWHAAVQEAEQPDQTLLDYIEQLRPKYKTAILSNANHGTLERKFGAEVLNRYFDAVAVSADIGMIKPDPQIYEYVASQLDAELHECLFIDDRELFVDQARELGMQAVLYQTLPQTLGELKAILANSENEALR